MSSLGYLWGATSTNPLGYQCRERRGTDERSHVLTTRKTTSTNSPNGSDNQGFAHVVRTVLGANACRY